MKNLFLLFLFFSLALACRANAASLTQSDSIPKKYKPVSSKNEKIYCSDFAKSRYKLLITGTKIKITRLYKEYIDNYSGVIKNGKIYSNNPDEKNQKELQGKYYKIEGKNFGVLNIENGDYEWFTECKQ
jgi:hypothetical protein